MGIMIAQIGIAFLALLLFLFSLFYQSAPNSLIKYLCWLPSIRSYHKARKAINKLQTENVIVTQLAPAIKSQATITDKDEGYKQIVAWLKKEGWLANNQTVTRLTRNHLIKEDFSQMEWLDGDIDDTKTTIISPTWGSSIILLNRMTSEYLKKQLTKVISCLALLIFLLQVVVTIGVI